MLWNGSAYGSVIQTTQPVGGGKEQRPRKRQNQSAKELQRMCPIISFSRVCSQKGGSHRKSGMSYCQNESPGQTVWNYTGQGRELRSHGFSCVLLKQPSAFRGRITKVLQWKS